MAIRLQDRRESSRATSRVNDSPPPDLSSLSWDLTHRQVAHGLAEELRSTAVQSGGGDQGVSKLARIFTHLSTRSWGASGYASGDLRTPTRLGSSRATEKRETPGGQNKSEIQEKENKQRIERGRAPCVCEVGRSDPAAVGGDARFRMPSCHASQASLPKRSPPP